MRLSKKAVEKTFEIELPEYSEPLSVTIRQARVGDDIRRRELVSEASLVIKDNIFGQEIKQKINTGEIRRFDVYLTLVDSNLQDEDEKGGITPWFVFHNRRLVDQSLFEKAYNALPPDVADAIYEKVLEVNPQWSNVAEDVGE
jgi:hypothetical protein